MKLTDNVRLFIWAVVTLLLSTSFFLLTAAGEKDSRWAGAALLSSMVWGAALSRWGKKQWSAEKVLTTPPGVC